MVHPTKSFTYIFMNQRAKSIFIFFMLGGVVSGIDRLLKRETLNDPFNYAHFAIAILIGGGLGWISYYLLAYFLSIAGDYMKGKATDREYRTVVAWSLMPSILSLVVIIPQFIFYGAGSNNFEFENYFYTENLLLSAFILVKAILGIWSIVILVKGVAYIQQFSIGKAILNIFVPFLVVAVIVVVFVAIISLAQSS